jgi:hypothetical protein
MAIDVAVWAGTVLKERCVLTCGRPSTKPHRKAARPPRSLSFNRARALSIGGLDLEAIAHDAGIAHQARHIFGAVAGDALRIECMERGAKILALLEDGQPRQAGLEALEHQLFKECADPRSGATPHSSSW